MIQQKISDSDTRLTYHRTSNKFILFTEIEQIFRKKFPKETKDKAMIRCFEGSSSIVYTYWQKAN